MPISPWVKAVRDIIGTDMVVMIGAAALVLNDDGQILLQQRTDNGLWGVPGGGIEPGEEPAQAAIREVYEETGYHVEVTRLVGVFGGKDQVKHYPNGDHFAYISMTFECRVIGGEINPDPDESLAVVWWDIDDLPSEFTAVHRRRIEVLQSGHIPYFAIPDGLPQTPTSDYIQQIRAKIGTQEIMMPSCNAVIFNEDGQILVQQRRNNGQCNLPRGIYEIGEEPAETIVREVYDKTGYIVRPTRLVGVYGGEETRYIDPSGDQLAFIAIVFVCEIIGGNPQHDANESYEMQWVDPYQLPDPFMDNYRRFIDHALLRTEPYFVS